MKKPKIKSDTVPNGYTLTVDGKEYMYFTVAEYLAGVLAHIGMEQKDYMTNEEILKVLFDALLGTEHAKKLAKMRSDIQKLESDYTIRLELLDKTYKRVKDYEDLADGLYDRVAKVRKEVQDLEAAFKKGKPQAQELLKGIGTLELKSYKLREEMKESRALIREMKMWQKKVEKAEKGEEPKPKEKPEPKPKPKARNYKTPDEQAAAYEKSKLRKRIQLGDATVFPDAGLIVHHTKKAKK